MHFKRVPELIRRYGRPPRKNARADVDLHELSDSKEAWEKLCKESIVCGNAFYDSRRKFASRIVSSKNARPDELSHPSTMDSVAFFASDPEGILEAEAQAREFARRLMPWHAVCDDNVVWYQITHPLEYLAYLGLPFNSACDTVNWTLEEYGIATESLVTAGNLDTLPRFARDVLEVYEGWCIALEKDSEILEPKWPLDVSKYKKFSFLQNPFEPLLELWLTGYLLASPFDLEDTTIRLYAVVVNPDAYVVWSKY